MNATTYNEYRPLICYLVRRFAKRYGGDVAELTCEANLHFVKALQTHNPSSGPLHKHVAWKVWYGMFETMRTRLRRNRICTREDVDLGTLAARKPLWTKTVLKELSEDARLVVGAALNVGSRNGLLRMLAEEWGWCGKRIIETFAEIRGAL